MSGKVKLSLLLLATITGATLFLARGRNEARQLSLTFQRYHDLYPLFDEGYFWLTNASDKTFIVYMTGGSNTMALDPALFTRRVDQDPRSFMIHCAFSDQTAHGWSNWVQEPVQRMGYNGQLHLAPHSGFVIRAPLPANGQKRKVAALCEAQPEGWRINLLTNSSYHQFLRMLPRPVRHKFYQFKPTRVQVWCDQELSHTGERVRRRTPAM